MRFLAAWIACVTAACGSSAGAGRDAPSSPSDAVADGGGSDDATPLTCGTRTGMRGLTHRAMTVAGLHRTYLVYLPPSASPQVPLPLVIVFHGFSMSGQDMADITGFTALADREGIAVAFPDGEGGPDVLVAPWNVKDAGEHVCGAGDPESASGDDFAFVDAIRADLGSDQCLDAAHEFATGFSMGGYFSEHVGCERSDLRAIAPASGGTLADLSACTTGHVPVILFHGVADPLIVDGCDDPHAAAAPGFPAAATLWAAKNGCAATYTTTSTTGSGGGTGHCYLYDGCPADGQVELCTFDAMPHCWAGGTGDFGCPAYASATELAWTFWRTYAW